MALNMLRLETSKKANIRRKKKMAAMNSRYLEKVILDSINELAKNVNIVAIALPRPLPGHKELAQVVIILYLTCPYNTH